jgi:Protein of unknown function (DUF3617)
MPTLRHRTIHRVFVCFAAALGLCAGSALAQVKMQAGLWEMRSKVVGAPGGAMAKNLERIQTQMANMPPEQRKAVQAMMAKQGIQMGNDGSTTLKMCVTQEMAARSQLPNLQEGNCSQKYAPRVGNAQSFSFSCTNPTSQGEGTLTFNGDKAYTSAVTVRTENQGVQDTITMNAQSKFLSTNCGAIKPMAPPKG